LEKVQKSKGVGGRRGIVPKCAKLGNYWGDFDEINSGYTIPND
jgi:hypothetical protein